MAGVIESASTAAVNETIGQYTNISFSFFARSGLKAYDKVVILIRRQLLRELFHGLVTLPRPGLLPRAASSIQI